MALAPSEALVSVPSSRIMAWSTLRWSRASKPSSSSAIGPLTLPTAVATPLPPNRSPPSRNSTASNSPVEAPEGTAARPAAPETKQDFDLDGRIAAGVEHLPSVDRVDRAREIAVHARLLGGGRALQTTIHTTHLGFARCARIREGCGLAPGVARVAGVRKRGHRSRRNRPLEGIKPEFPHATSALAHLFDGGSNKLHPCHFPRAALSRRCRHVRRRPR